TVRDRAVTVGEAAKIAAPHAVFPARAVDEDDRNSFSPLDVMQFDAVGHGHFFQFRWLVGLLSQHEQWRHEKRQEGEKHGLLSLPHVMGPPGLLVTGIRGSNHSGCRIVVERTSSEMNISFPIFFPRW